jgi:hypothetical protein
VNTNRKNRKSRYMAVCLLLLCGGCITQNPIAQVSDSDCEMIHKGKIEYNEVSNNNAQANSAYVECAIGVKIDEPGGIDSGNPKPLDITSFADHFLRKIDTGYKDKYGNSLLSMVVISFTPTDWKLKTVQKLFNDGVDIHSKNIFDKTALDLAKTGGEPELTRLLESLGSAKDKQSPLNLPQDTDASSAANSPHN